MFNAWAATPLAFTIRRRKKLTGNIVERISI